MFEYGGPFYLCYLIFSDGTLGKGGRLVDSRIKPKEDGSEGEKRGMKLMKEKMKALLC